MRRRWHRSARGRRLSDPLRALWAALIVSCLLAIGGQPADAARPRDRHAAQVKAAPHAALSALLRRTSVPDGQLRPLCVAPSLEVGDEPERCRVLEREERPAAPEPARLDRTTLARGPPRR